MPRYKSCSGQLIKKSLDLVQKYYGEPVPEFTMCAPEINKGMIFTDDKGQTFRFEQGGLNIWRSSFDKWLADKAAFTIWGHLTWSVPGETRSWTTVAASVTSQKSPCGCTMPSEKIF